MKNFLNNWVKLAISITLPFVAGFIGSIFTAPAISSWYSVLQKPYFSPPDWLFGPVWTLLYVLMGVAFFEVWKNRSEGNEAKWSRIALWIFGVQLVLNAIWSVIFFGLRNPGLAFVEIIFLWVAILFSIVAFYKISRLAAFLLLPYIFWVTFAGYLNFMIWMLN